MSLLAKYDVKGLPAKLLSIADAAQTPEQVLAELDSSPLGLSLRGAQDRLAAVGPNALRSHKASMVSAGLGFSNEFRAERVAEALHSRVTHTAVVLRDRSACGKSPLHPSSVRWHWGDLSSCCKWPAPSVLRRSCCPPSCQGRSRFSLHSPAGYAGRWTVPT
ncbi:cation-transporting P-type ATPase [Arthrobacter psychrochitiniphilus]|uniref:cation-transporting P-type ATPase n=1 Tax=Arthrobacter psychrochitiniphilus TaxID=291045 RepID=UPI003F7C05EA